LLARPQCCGSPLSTGAIDADESTIETFGEWRFWLAQGILLPLSRGTPRSRQVLLIECLAYQRLDHRLSTDIQLFGSLENFLQGSGSSWEWDDFTLSLSFQDPTLEAIRQRCAGLGKEFPPGSPDKYCGEGGLKVLQSYISELRKTG
jgi:hypothetical protein